ncbi:beta-lactamase, partial [Aureobasidium melanogenum]
MAMRTLENDINEAIKAKKIAGCVLLAASHDDRYNYSKAFGQRSMEADSHALQTTDVFALISCGKLLVSIATLQLVERNLVSLDTDVGALIPELACQSILTGFTHEGLPMQQQRREPIRVRDLLTHVVGLSCFDPLLVRYFESQGRTPLQETTVAQRFAVPLLAEVGASFHYGPSFDWLGRIVEILTGVSLDTYVQNNICNPLNIKDIFFSMKNLKQVQERLVSTSMLAEGGVMKPNTQGSINDIITECFGGQSGHANLESFLTVLRSLTANDGKLLQQGTVDMMFRPQLGKESKLALNKQIKERSGLVHLFTSPEEGDYDWNFAGRVRVQDGKPEFTDWFGMMNTYWFIDHKRGICGLFGTQSLPMGEPESMELCRRWVQQTTSQ